MNTRYRTGEGDVEALARRIWDYHHVHHDLTEADAIIALGSHDLRVAERAADVYLAGWAPLLVCSGHLGALTRGVWKEAEADLFAAVAIDKGVPRDKVLVEDRATHTGENVAFSRQLLADRGISVARVIAVQKPYMERRTWATFRRVWPEVEVRVTSPQLGFGNYPTSGISREDVIHIMVGDLQRIMVYGEKGFQIPQEVPADVLDAYERLVALGYTRRLLTEE
jgi:uncharacterized SAM-binding protein YcdF (DUF218 family)